MSQAPTKTASVNYEDVSSSPDPLATSVDDDPALGSVLSPSKQKSTYIIKRPRRASKPTRHELRAIPSSPFRAASEQNISPWKIRVTVEAEQEESDMDNTATRRVTRTMQIPLRQDSSPGDQEDGSVRGRISRTSPSKGKRSATPVRGGRQTGRARRQSVTDLNVRPLGDDADEDDWLRQQRSPRKRRASRSRKSAQGSEVITQPASSLSQLTGKSKVSEFEIRRDPDAESDDGLARHGHATSESQAPGLRDIGVNRVAVRPRGQSSKSTENGEGDAPEFQDNDGPAIVPMREPSEGRKVSVNSAKSYPTPSPSSSPRGDPNDIGKPASDISPIHEGFDTILESEGFTMIDLETLPSAKRYFSSPTEVEVDKLAGSPGEASSQKQEFSATLTSDRDSSRGIEPSTQTGTITYQALHVDDSDISSTVPSSPPVLEREKSLLQLPNPSASTARKVTPQPYSSPKLPSPPKQDVRRTPHHQHRGSVSALVAGAALQGVVSPQYSDDRVSAKEKRTVSPSGDLENGGVLFQGFDSGTQRELRAGLRFGEELARRQPQSQLAPVSSTVSSTTEKARPLAVATGTASKTQASVNRQAITQVWRGEHVVQRTPIQVSAGASTQVTESRASLPQTPQIPPSTTRDKTLLDTQARREREWQLEREAISRQIQNANESQVIVIDSDSDDEDQALPERGDADAGFDSGAQENEEEEDIWLVEAKNSSSPGPTAISPPQSHQDNGFIHPDQAKPRDRAKEAFDRPRRSLIPSPWKRGDDIDVPPDQSTFVSTNADDLSGLLFYKEPESKILFGAGEIKRQRLRQRSGSGTFDIDLMAGTPREEQVEDSVDDTRLSTQTEEDQTPGQNPGNDSVNAPESTSSAIQPIKIAVDLDDSLMSTPTQPGGHVQSGQLRPPSQDQPVLSSPQRPPTPRSALKGARQSFPGELGPERSNTTSMTRRVVFSERSRGVDIDGLESSFSMRSGSDNSTAGELEGQLNRELQAHQESPSSIANACEEDRETEDEFEDDDEPPAHHVRCWVPEDVSTTARSTPASASAPAPAKQGWAKWFWGSKATKQAELDLSSSSDQDKDHQESRSSPIPSPERMDGTEDEEDDGSDSRHRQSPGWEQTRSSIAFQHRTSNANKRMATTASSSTQPQPQLEASVAVHGAAANNNSATSVVKLPSYLLPPSCPSDPARSANSPLALSGSFTNTHFRTLHIIYRKSLRPKFHAPSRRTIRPGIMALLGMEMEIDETAHGVDGVFTWKVGQAECQVLERFMQECEFSQGVWMGRKICPEHRENINGNKRNYSYSNGNGNGNREIEMDRNPHPNPYSSSSRNINTMRLGDNVAVQWGWSVEQLAEWLCRIVVGEVVREEEQIRCSVKKV